MGIILCATRGGEESIHTQDYAIQRAKEGGDSIVFLYIFDLDFLGHVKLNARPDLLTEEIVEMAGFLMLMAVERAENASVTASSLIRHGKFAAELAAAARSSDVSLVILGRPAEQGHFKESGLVALARTLSDETGIPFILRPAEQPGH